MTHPDYDFVQSDTGVIRQSRSTAPDLRTRAVPRQDLRLPSHLAADRRWCEPPSPGYGRAST